MKNLLKIFTVFLILVSTSCTQEDLIDSSIESTKASNSTQDITAFATGEVIGSATLHRKKDRVTANINTSGLTPGDAYTVWFIIFNPDLITQDNPHGFIDAVYATGGVVGNNGVANFYASLSEGDASGSIATNVGLVDAEHNGVHMIIRSHGPVIPGMEYEQTTTINGGCGPDLNECVDEADVIFQAIQ